MTRFTYALVAAIIFGLLFWKQGGKIKDQQSLFTVFGSMFSAVLFLGINNCSTTIRHICTERIVFHRERFTGMYSPWAYAFAQVSEELPYMFVLALIFTSITYPMIGYYPSAIKVLWYFYALFFTLVYFNCMAMVLMAVTPNFQLAQLLASAIYSFMNLYSGFLIPQPHIPKCWLWLYYANPTSWTLRGLLTSQYGDIDDEIIAFGTKQTVASFVYDYFGFHQDELGLTAAILILIPLTLVSLFAIFIAKLNFQRR